VTRFLEGLIARAIEARPTAAPPHRPRLFAPTAAEPPPLGQTADQSPAVYRAREPAPAAPPAFERGRAEPRPAAPAAKPEAFRPADRRPEPPRDTIAASPADAAPVSPRAEPGEAPSVVEASETLIVEALSPQAAERVGRAFETAVTRIFAPEPPRTAATPPAPSPAPSVVTSIVIGRVELTAAPAAAPPRAASSTKAPMSLDEYLSRRGQVGR